MDWIGNIFIVIGLWKTGDKWRPSFLFSIVGESIYVYYAFSHELWGLGLICIVFAVIAVRNYQKWGITKV